VLYGRNEVADLLDQDDAGEAHNIRTIGIELGKRSRTTFPAATMDKITLICGGYIKVGVRS
jgi:hypothetical protein